MTSYQTHIAINPTYRVSYEWDTYEEAKAYVAACKRHWPKSTGYIVRIKEHIYA